MHSLLECMQKKRRGFTLVELLVVIVVLAVLAAIVLPKFMDSSKRSKEAALKGNLKLMRNAITLFKTDTDLYPLALADLAATSAPAQGSNGTADTALTASTWHGPYLQAVPVDPTNGGGWTYTKTTGTVVSTNTNTGLVAAEGAYNTW